MTPQFWLRLAGLVVAAVLGVALIQAWRAEQRDRSQLAAELAATQQLLAAADARQHDRDAQLTQTLAALAAKKRTIVTPSQIVRELPHELPLPAPITLQSSPATPATPGQAPDATTQAVIPAEDLKPLYDFTLDCKACQAKLAAAQGNLADEQKKTVALTHERDQAIRIARGGSAWRRIGRAAKWFAIGAAAGAVISRAR